MFSLKVFDYIFETSLVISITIIFILSTQQKHKKLKEQEIHNILLLDIFVSIYQKTKINNLYVMLDTTWKK